MYHGRMPRDPVDSRQAAQLLCGIYINMPFSGSNFFPGCLLCTEYCYKDEKAFLLSHQTTPGQPPCVFFQPRRHLEVSLRLALLVEAETDLQVNKFQARAGSLLPSQLCTSGRRCQPPAARSFPPWRATILDALGPAVPGAHTLGPLPAVVVVSAALPHQDQDHTRCRP